MQWHDEGFQSAETKILFLSATSTEREKNRLKSVELQSTLVISNFKGLSEILRDIRSSTYQVCRIEEKNNLINHI